MFLLKKEIDAPHDSLNHNCFEEQDPDVILTHATILSHTFTLPQFMDQHNYEDKDPTDTPITVPTALQAPSDDTYNPKCTHNPMEAQCNQSQYPPLMKQNCTHNPSVSQVSQKQPLQPCGFPIPTRFWGACFGKVCYTNSSCKEG